MLFISFHFYPSNKIGAVRPTEIVKSLYDDYDVDLISEKVDKKQEELKKNFHFVDTLYSIPDGPKIIDFIWMQIKKFRGIHKKKLPETNLKSDLNVEDIPAHTEKFSFIARCRQRFFSYQAFLDALKVWTLLAVIRVFWIFLKGRRYDLIVSSGPPFAVNIVALLSSKLFRVPWVMDARDPIIMDSDKASKGITLVGPVIEKCLEKVYLHSALKIIVTAPSLEVMLQSKYPQCANKISLVFNGFDAPVTGEASDSPGILRMIYGGALYLNRDPIPLFNAVADLLSVTEVDRQKISFDLYGKCDDWRGLDLNEWLRQHGLDDVIKIHGQVSPEEIQRLTKECNVIVNFSQGQPMQIPAKTFEHISMSREILLLSEHHSDAAQLVEKNGFGRVANTDEILTVLADLYHFYVIDQKKFVSDMDHIMLYSRQNQNRRWLKVVETINE